MLVNAMRHDRNSSLPEVSSWMPLLHPPAARGCGKKEQSLSGQGKLETSSAGQFSESSSNREKYGSTDVLIATKALGSPPKPSSVSSQPGPNTFLAMPGQDVNPVEKAPKQPQRPGVTQQCLRVLGHSEVPAAPSAPRRQGLALGRRHTPSFKGPPSRRGRKPRRLQRPAALCAAEKTSC